MTDNHQLEPTELDLRMMRRALELARQAAVMDEVPVGAVVYQGERILGEGFNLRESSADPTAHAEILAIRQAAKALGSWRLANCSLAVTLEPCPMCAGAMLNARVQTLVYGSDDPKMGCVHTLYQLCQDTRFNHRLQVIRNVMAQEAREALSEFFRKLRHNGTNGKVKS
ncbi:MAG: nucleoside deaminase [Phycisphaeraceae bacterium]|nr:nucleoside deaminase [Phycisphaeraceae bacterium]